MIAEGALGAAVVLGIELKELDAPPLEKEGMAEGIEDGIEDGMDADIPTELG